MYWLYLIIFLAMLLVPRFSREDWFPMIVNREITEIVFLFVLASIALVLYILRDYQFVRYQRNFEEKQREVSRLLKDLSTTYSYIGETNRKIEILRDIMLDFPELLEQGREDGESMYNDILKATRSFTSCSEFVLRFYDRGTQSIVHELWSSDDFQESISQEIDPNHILKDKNRSMERQGEYLLLQAHGTFDGVCCYAIFHKNYLKKENIEIVRSLMIQALFLYSYAHRAQAPLPQKALGGTVSSVETELKIVE